jgi:hypothetical protein
VEEYDRSFHATLAMAPPRGFTQVTVEFETLRSFFVAADEAGLPLPEDSQLTRILLQSPVYSTHDWPRPELLSVLALAQHHGLPTRLLDWTWDSQVAAFFAARDALKNKSDALAVWALSASTLHFEYLEIPVLLGMEKKKPAPDFRVSIVTAPTATNPNLRAQRGLFTLLTDQRKGIEIGKDPPPSLDEAVRRLLMVTLCKFILPTTEAKQLLRLLALEGMTAARLFPGYRGVVESMEDERLWDPPKSDTGAIGRHPISQAVKEPVLGPEEPAEMMKALNPGGAFAENKEPKE